MKKSAIRKLCTHPASTCPPLLPPPPPIIIKFVSPAIRLIILKNKRTNIPQPTEGEKASGLKRFFMAEDLTTPTFRKLQELLKDERVSKAWTIGGEIWVVPQGENMRAFRVKSVYDDNNLILS